MSRKQQAGHLTLLAGMGIAAGLGIGAFVRTRQFKHPDHILTNVKASFRKSGPLDGAWIEHHPVPFKRFGTQAMVYQGGVMKHEDGQLIVYDFLADSKSGKVVDVWKDSLVVTDNV
ncbi:hypothetical protein [Furfurilactobacillus siliginis]|uniref:PepSY domain-containing protein n=1 Tax=Furfurilactobacillus siliginis TaxID=348151 RepID=A0A0R2KZ19_9LACO|nr:hypothetical protein [Furfurilactobacillus siliginis]KRN94512.1 hypothetical protein IV55_GL000498 [Furfurilactobacillus siliginis]GEK28553.1 hypothetical protein LSI01_08640 [Furfurilactobacillus siliginis]